MNPSIRKILILRFSSLGDIVMTTAMIRAVRKAYPFAQIDMVVREDFLDLIRENPHLDQKMVVFRKGGLRGLLRLLKELNRERYDLVYDAHRSLRTAFLMPFLKCDFKAYFSKRYLKRNWALLFKWPRLTDQTRLLERFIEPLVPYGVRYDGKGPEIFVSEKARSGAQRKVALPVLHPTAKRIGLVPSAQWPGKRWPLDRFRSLLQQLVAETPHQFVVFGGKEDTFVGDLVAGFPSDRVIRAQGKLSILESAAHLAQCQALVANDTGLMHMADALGVPSVLFLGPTSGALGCLPFHPKSQVLEHDLWCRPCSKNGQAVCIRRERFCLTLTRVSDAKAALERALS